jgi:hypothetical protein
MTGGAWLWYHCLCICCTLLWEMMHAVVALFGPFNFHWKTVDATIIRPYVLFSSVLAEWKPPVYDNSHGIKLSTATTRRNSPNVRSI